MEPVRLEQGNSARLLRVKGAIRRLPALERELWSKRLRRVLDKGPRAQIAGEWGVTSPGNTETEWDLWLANKLDDIYSVVSDRVEEVAAKGGTVVKEAAKTAGEASASVGLGLLPLALAAVAFAWAFSTTRRA